MTAQASCTSWVANCSFVVAVEGCNFAEMLAEHSLALVERKMKPAERKLALTNCWSVVEVDCRLVLVADCMLELVDCS